MVFLDLYVSEGVEEATIHRSERSSTPVEKGYRIVVAVFSRCRGVVSVGNGASVGRPQCA
jgi:hypothetical protein